MAAQADFEAITKNFAATAATVLGAVADPQSSQDLKGSMDGERAPANKLLELLQPIQQRYGHLISRIRPWREFFVVSKPVQSEVQKRLETNLVYYQVNYGIVFLLFALISILTNPHCLIAIAVLVAAWLVFLRKNEDPEWQTAVAGVSLDKPKRVMVMAAITGVVLIVVLGNLLLWTAFVCSLAVLAHGACHPIPEAIADVPMLAEVL